MRLAKCLTQSQTDQSKGGGLRPSPNKLFRSKKITDQNYTHILAIVDRSGSMGFEHVNVEMANALNEYFKSQVELPGTCLVDYVQFDDTSELVFEGRPVGYAKAVIEPRGMTALLDAVGKSVVQLGSKLALLPEARRPGKVQVVIVTDGHENASSEYTYESVKALVEEQTSKYNWDFVFLGANIDAPTVGAAFGVARDKSLTFNINSNEAIANTTQSLAGYTTAYRGAGGAAAAVFTDEDRKKAATGS